MKCRFFYMLLFLLVSLQLFAQRTTRYKYDANNRLTQVTYANGATVNYTYDELGNRLTKKAAPQPGMLPGDANGDGDVSVTDVVVIISYVLGENPDGFNESSADVNGDGSVTVADAVQVLDIILNK